MAIEADGIYSKGAILLGSYRYIIYYVPYIVYGPYEFIKFSV